MKTLVIVESPTKARTIGKFLGDAYEIRASMGHVMDLPKSTLAIDIAHNFAPQYEMIADKKKIVAELKTLAKSADVILLATDPDREGEAIAYHVAQLIADSKWQMAKEKNHTPLAIRHKQMRRIVFHEITEEAIKDALSHPRDIDKNLVDAQTARRVLDRLVGYKLSPILWQKIRRGLSAGRVQSVALRLIVEREKEIEKFKKEPYFTITVILVSEAHPVSDSGQAVRRPELTAEWARMTKQETPFELIEIDGKKIEEQESFDLYDGEYKVSKTTIDSEESAKQIVKELLPTTFIVSDVSKKEMHRSPQAPYTTSTLQQDASRRFGFSGKRTMTIAQKLYEEGHITYHRTDSVTIATSAVSAIRKYAEKEFGNKYIPEKPRMYTAKQKLAQEAHEAIRPTRIMNDELRIKNEMGNDFGKLYGLIWKRALASQMSDAITESTVVLVDSETQKAKSKTQNKGIYRLKANGSVLLFDGFLKVNPLGLGDTVLPEFTVSEKLTAQEVMDIAHETTPPPRYNDASLIKTLEEKGIGRPSTYATIVGTIESRQYIERNEGRFTPTSVGSAVTEFLVAHFAEIDDIPFTATMEDELDLIADGKKAWVPVLKSFYTPFEKALKSVKDAARVKIAVETVDEKCPKCGESLVIRTGRFGKFLSCSTFPKCDFRKSFVETTGFTCPKDQGQIIVKKTKKGRKFFGCSNYPACTFAVWRLMDIKKKLL